MPKGDRSQRMFDNVTDIIRNHGFEVESALGLIWKKFTDAQAHFVEDLDVSRVKYHLPLAPGQTDYEIDPWILKITHIEFSRIDFNPIIQLPDNTIDDHRSIIIHEPEQPDSGLTIAQGDVMIIEAFIACVDGTVIDEANDPIIPARFDRHLEDYVLADYATDKLRVKNKDKVDEEVKKKVDQMYSLNRIKTTKINITQFG